MEEEFELGSQLSRGHALQILFFEVVFDFLSVELPVQSEGLIQNAAASHRELHPELLESLGVELACWAELNLCRAAVQQSGVAERV